jgi:hypothetical protein
VEHRYKQQKGQLGWADYMVRTDRAMQRHWQLAVCAFTFCWQQAPPGAVGSDTALAPGGGDGAHGGTMTVSGEKSGGHVRAHAPAQ